MATTAAPVPSLPEVWQQAASFAARAHDGQRRKDGLTPYVAHLARVTLTLAVVFGCQDPAVLAAALLHDTIEDTTTDFDDLEGMFGADIAGLVAALTKNSTLRESLREPEYDARLAAADWRARLIKLADVYDNYADGALQEPGDAKARAKRAGKARRAIKLAEQDAADHPETARAIAAVKGLLGRRRAGPRASGRGGRR